MGTASVALTIDGVKVGESSLSVRPSSSEYVQFPYTFPTEGTHRIACTQGGAWGDQKDVIVSNPSCMLILGAHSGRVWSVAFSPNDRLLASWDDEMVRLWELPAGNPVRSIPYKAYGGRYNLLCFSPDGTLLVLSDHRCHGSRTDSCVQIWEVGTGQLFRTLPTDPAYWSNAFGGGYFVEDAAFSPDGRLLALFGGGAIRLHDVATGRLVRPFEGAEYLPAEPGSPDTKSPEYSGVNDVAFSRDGRRLFYAFLLMDHPELASRSSSTIVVEWDVATGRIVGNTRMPEGTNGCLYFSNDMTEFVSEVSGTAQFWDMGSRSVRQAFQVDLWGVSATALSPDGTVLASSGIHDPRIIKLWDVSTGQLLRTLEGHSDTVWSLAFSSDGGMLASCSSDGTARVWNVDGLRTP
jgi:WD40 repeat protein